MTFLRLCIERMYGLETYSVYNEPMKYESCGSVFPDGRWFPHNERTGQPYSFVKTHGHADEHNTTHPAIALIRDGRDAIASHAHLVSRYRGDPFNMVLALFVSGEEWNWGQHILQWVDRPNTAIVRFRDLIRLPAHTTRRAVNQLGLDLTPRVECDLPDFKALHKHNPHFFRKGKIGAWQQDFTDALHDQFWYVHGEAMERIGYSRKAACVA